MTTNLAGAFGRLFPAASALVMVSAALAQTGSDPVPPSPGPGYMAPVIMNVPSFAEQKELIFWESIRSSMDPADFDDFLSRYPQSEFASIARRRLVALQRAASGTRTTPQPHDAVGGEADRSMANLLEVQRALRLLGHYRGEADGGFGAGTRAAVKEFKSFEGLPETGQLSGTERKRLLELAQTLAGILDQAPISPQGIPAASVIGAEARYARGWAAEKGKMRRDTAEAIYWYALAGCENNARALTNLGTMVARGQGVESADPAAAAILWHAAAARAEGTAMFNLGALYERGIGVAVDPDRARAWYRRAATYHHAGAVAALKRLGL